jgi:hypothetical protein
MAVASRIPLNFEHRLVYRGRLRPDTSFPALEEVREWRDENFKPTTDRSRPQSWVINLEGSLLSSDALYEAIVPLGEGIRDGRYGPSVLFVATSSPQMRDLLASMAMRHRFPLFLLDSINSSLVEAIPVGPLTASDRTVLDHLVSAGGVATSAQLANAEGLELAAAHQRHYVAKVERPRKQGNQFIDLRVAFAPRHDGSLLALPNGEFDPGNPAHIEALVAEAAKAQGREPAEVLADVWRAFLSRDYESEAAEFRAMAQRLAAGDRDAVRRLVRGQQPDDEPGDDDNS